MNTTLRIIVLIIFIHVVYVLPLAKPGLPKNHDAQLHTARIAAYYKAFADGHIPPRWASDLNYGYGTPLFIFYSPLSGILGSFLHWLGANFEDSYKILIASAFIIAPVSFYLFIRQLFPPWTSFVSSLFYGLAPYHFLDLFVRGAVAELLFLALVPFLFLSIELLRKRATVQRMLLGGCIYGILIITHNIMALLFSAIAVTYGFIRLLGNKRAIVNLCGVFLVGLGLSAFYWMPAYFEQIFTHSSLFIGRKYLEHFPTVGQLVTSPWGFGPDVNKTGGLSPRIGIIPIAISLAGLFLIRRTGKNYRWIMYWAFGVLGLSIIMSLQWSSFLWNRIGIIQKFEFPWRFTAVSSFASAAISAVVLSTVKNRAFHNALITLLLVSSIPLTTVPQFESKNDAYFTSYSSSTDFGAVTPVWTAGDPSRYPKNPVEIIAGIGNITEYTRQSVRHTFTVLAESGITVLDNTLYFPGWQARIDGGKIPIQFQDPNNRGLITFTVPQGLHMIDVSFHDSPVRTIANVISLSTVAVLLLSYFLYKWNLSRRHLFSL
jgi:hypothetical protein